MPQNAFAPSAIGASNRILQRFNCSVFFESCRAAAGRTGGHTPHVSRKMHLHHLFLARRRRRQLLSLGCYRWRKGESCLFIPDAKCTCTIFSSSNGSVRFTKTDGSLTTRTAPSWRCPRHSSPTLDSATSWRLSNIVCGFLSAAMSLVRPLQMPSSPGAREEKLAKSLPGD